MKSVFLILTAVFSIWVSAQSGDKPLPQEAQALLSKLPQSAITLEVVLGLGLSQSDQFNSIVSAKLTEQQDLLTVESQFDPLFFSRLNFVDNRNQTSGLFQPRRIETQALEMGISKAFSTGTFFEAKLVGNQVRTTFKDLPAEFAAGLPDPNLTNVNSVLTLSQDLSRNFFGSASRKLLKAAAQSSDAKGLEMQTQVEDLAIQLVEAFYNAWSAQARVRADENKVQRQLQLKKIVEIQKARGTSEEPDFLQVSNAYILAEEALRESRVQLNTIWNQLIVLLKLPSSFTAIDPLRVPMLIERGGLRSLSYCKNYDFQENPRFKMVKLRSEAAQLRLEAQKSQFLPQLTFNFIYDANGTDRDPQAVIENSLYGRFPSTTVGLNLQIPLQQYEAQRDFRQSLQNQILSEIGESQVQDELVLEQKNLCEELTRVSSKIARVEAVLKSQTRRAELERNRFRLNQATAFQAVQAETDLIDAELLMFATKSQERVLDWKILKNSGRIAGVLNEAAEKMKTVKGLK